MDESERLIYRGVRFLTNLFYPETELIAQENIPAEPCILIGNHCQIHGPIIGELYIPGHCYIWCAQEMMHLKEVPAYAYRDFWSRKPGWSKWFYKLLSYIMAPLCICIFNNAHTIPVYRDGRVLQTFRKTLEKLQNGRSVVIFPEYDAPYNHILSDFQPGFVDVARSYYKQTGKKLQFVPMYLAPKLKKVYVGNPITYDPSASAKEERMRICRYLMEQITAVAQSLPRHVVIPYNNVPKKDYVFNCPQEVDSNEKAGS